MESETVVVQASKTKSLVIFAIAVGFVALGLWFLSLDREVIEAKERYNNPTLIYGLGWVTVLFFGIGMAASGWRLYSRKPGLVLNRDGVKIFAFTQDTFLPWREVAGLSVFEVHRNKMLVLNLRDPERYVEMGGKIRRVFARANFRLCGSPIAISSNALRLNFAELQNLFERHIKRYGNAAYFGND